MKRRKQKKSVQTHFSQHTVRYESNSLAIMGLEMCNWILQEFTLIGFTPGAARKEQRYYVKKKNVAYKFLNPDY